MDNAIGQLERQGIVHTETLDDLLADDEPNYRITLTDSGRAALHAGTGLTFFDCK